MGNLREVGGRQQGLELAYRPARTEVEGAARISGGALLRHQAAPLSNAMLRAVNDIRKAMPPSLDSDAVFRW